MVNRQRKASRNGIDGEYRIRELADMLNHLKDEELYDKLRRAASMWFRRTEQIALEELIKRYEEKKRETKDRDPR